MMLAGGCVCGKIRYGLTRSPMITQACHCRDCQRITGGAFAINMWIEREYFETLAGKPKSFKRAAAGSIQFFLRHMRTIVWHRYAVNYVGRLVL
jgi:hypothetical protein